MRAACVALSIALLLPGPIWAASPPPNSLDIDPSLYNLGWKIEGAAPIAPRLVFDNGRKVFLKFREGSEIPDMLAETPSGLVLLGWVSDPPYVAVPNLKGAIRFRIGRLEARASKSGYYSSTAPLNITDTAAAPEPEATEIAVPATDNNKPTEQVQSAEPAPVIQPVPYLSIRNGVALPILPDAGPPAPGDSTAPVLTAAIPTVDVTASTPEPVPPTPPTFKAVAGMTLQGVVTAWAKEAGWILQWNTDLDFGIAADFSLQGDFLDVANALFSAYTNAPRRFAVQAFPKMDVPVLLVTEKK